LFLKEKRGQGLRIGGGECPPVFIGGKKLVRRRKTKEEKRWHYSLRGRKKEKVWKHHG